LSGIIEVDDGDCSVVGTNKELLQIRRNFMAKRSMRAKSNKQFDFDDATRDKTRENDPNISTVTPHLKGSISDPSSVDAVNCSVDQSYLMSTPFSPSARQSSLPTMDSSALNDHLDLNATDVTGLLSNKSSETSGCKRKIIDINDSKSNESTLIDEELKCASVANNKHALFRLVSNQWRKKLNIYFEEVFSSNAIGSSLSTKNDTSDNSSKSLMNNYDSNVPLLSGNSLVEDIFVKRQKLSNTQENIYSNANHPDLITSHQNESLISDDNLDYDMLRSLDVSPRLCESPRFSDDVGEFLDYGLADTSVSINPSPVDLTSTISNTIFDSKPISRPSSRNCADQDEYLLSRFSSFNPSPSPSSFNGKSNSFHHRNVKVISEEADKNNHSKTLQIDNTSNVTEGDVNNDNDSMLNVYKAQLKLYDNGNSVREPVSTHLAKRTGSQRAWRLTSQITSDKSYGISLMNFFENPADSLSQFASTCFTESSETEIEEAILRRLCGQCGYSIGNEIFF
jgi:hypothetical protein